MPRKTKRKSPQSYDEYAGFGTPEMRRRAIEAGCKTVAEYCEWFDKHYGRDQNRFHAPPPYRRPG